MVPLCIIRVAPPPFGLLRLYMIIDKKDGICRPIKKGFKSGRMVPRAPESYTEGPFIIFNSVRKSNLCTEILIKNQFLEGNSFKSCFFFGPLD